MKNKSFKITLVALLFSIVLSACGKEIDPKEDFDFSVVSREDGSGTREAFIKLTGLEEEKDGETSDNTTEEAIIQNSTNGIMQTVSIDSKAIGYTSLGSLNDTVKVVNIDGVKPTHENIKNGSYKLQREFILAYEKEGLDDLSKDFLEFTLSEDAQKIVSKDGYISVNSKDYFSKKPSGSITIAGSTSVAPVMEKLIEFYKTINPDAKVNLQLDGSGAGIESTISGVTQIAMSSRDLKDDEKKKLDYEVLAKDGIAVVVNIKNEKINDLTLKQLKEIFEGKITNTSQLKKWFL